MLQTTLKTVLIMLFMTLIGCGDFPFDNDKPVASCTEPAHRDYRITSNCGYSRELGCRVCEVVFSDGRRGAKCQTR